MELEFQRFVLRLARRARLVRGLERAQLPLSFALGLILGYRLLRLFGLAGELPGWWLAAFAWACGLVGFLHGYLSQVELADLLFRVDRRLGLHERLSSLYELYRGRGRPEFIPLISARLPARLEPKLALPLKRRGFLLPAGLLLALLLLGWPYWPASPLFPPTKEGQVTGLSRLEALEERLRALEEELGGLVPRPRPALKGSHELRERLAALEEELWGPEAEPALQGEVMARLAQALSVRGEGPLAPAQREASWRATLEELTQLASQLKGGALKELLARLGKAREREGAGRAQAQAEALWRDLALVEALVERLEEAKRRMEGEEQPEFGLSPGQAGEEGPSPPEGGESRGQEKGLSSEERGSPGGEEAGTTPGEWPSGLLAAPPLSWPAVTREFHISGELGETGEIERLITRGTPFELSGPEGEPLLRLDFQRVRASLEERAIPPEAQGVVQRYFLIITEVEEK